MGMSTYVEGVCDPTEEYRQKYKALMACLAAKVQVPMEVDAYFGGADDPEEGGMTVHIPSSKCVTSDGEGAGLEVNIENLPPGVTRIRFINYI